MSNTWSIDTLSEELVKAFPMLGRQIAAHLRATGDEETTLMQVGVLNQIKERSTTASELAKMRRVSLQSVSVLVQGMVERGWIIRAPDPTDRRQFLLQITPEGVAKADTTHNQIVGFLMELLADVTEEEIAAAQIFLPALRRMLTQHMAIDSQGEQEEQTQL
ncbi:MAG: MarR family transcriptional regulator [Burkholderiales bacterium]|nr:MarR family transcriptional regulator [Anaerolineae bacterium]